MTTQALGTSSATELAEMQELEVRASPFSALYAHWERNQWSPLELDLAADRASFAVLEGEEQAGLLWIFAHRFHAEFNVARLLAPLLLARAARIPGPRRGSALGRARRSTAYR